MEYEIFTDLSADTDLAVLSENDVKLVPMDYMVGSDSYTCTEPVSAAAMHTYYDRLRKKETTGTSQVSPARYFEVFEPYAKEGRPVLFIVLSSGLSNTYNSALMAVSDLKEKYEGAAIEVVDSLGATGGMGLLVEAACRNRKAGMPLRENAEQLRALATKVNYYFKVEDLMYLLRGGRLSAATAVVGTVLDIKPILTVDAEGKLATIAKKRGNKQALNSLVEKFRADFDPSVINSVYICTADAPDIAEQLKARVLAEQPGVDVKITMLSPIIGAHTGPDMAALIFFGKEKA